MAVPVLDTALVEMRKAIGNDPVVSAIQDIISSDAIGRAEPVQALDTPFVLKHPIPRWR